MSRYTITDRGEGLFTPYRIYGPDGERIATISVHVESEIERLKRWIEAAPESDGVMDGIIKRANEPLYQPSNVRKEER